MARTKRNNGDNGSPVSAFQHGAAARLNIPEATETQAGLSKGKKRIYRYSPHLSPKLQFDPTGASDQVPAIIEKVFASQQLTDDEADILRTLGRQWAEPWLEWAGKQEQQARGSFAVDDVVLHIHERISAQAILATARRQDVAEQDFFARPKLHQEQALQYYRHSVDWANRLILCDSLQVMSSLANSENLAGRVQMIYFDPPYGIKFSSNWQNEVGKREVKEKDEDLTREPEMIRAYRDTWTLGVHSYLAYLKQRLILVRKLLADSGSIFVQISDENLHRVRAVMDEVFGAKHYIAQIQFQKTTSATNDFLPVVADSIIWYAKDREKAKAKYRNIYRDKALGDDGADHYSNVLLETGETRSLTADEAAGLKQLPKGARAFTASDLTSASIGRAKGEGAACWFPVTCVGKTLRTNEKNRWKTNEDGMKRLVSAERVIRQDSAFRFRRYLDDFSAF